MVELYPKNVCLYITVASQSISCSEFEITQENLLDELEAGKSVVVAEMMGHFLQALLAGLERQEVTP